MTTAAKHKKDKKTAPSTNPTKSIADNLFHELRGRGLSTKDILQLTTYLIENLIEEQREVRNSSVATV